MMCQPILDAPPTGAPTGRLAARPVGVHVRVELRLQTLPWELLHGPRGTQQVPANALHENPIALCRARHPPGHLLDGILEVWPILGQVVESGTQRAELRGLGLVQQLAIRLVLGLLHEVVLADAAAVGRVVPRARRRHGLGCLQLQLLDHDLGMPLVRLIRQALGMPLDDAI